MATWTKEVVDLSVAGSALTIDNVKIDGTNIGHTDDTDLLALASGALTVNGTIATTGNATIGGDLTITGGDLTLGSVNYLSDSSGTGTLKNIDALDATTEATIEAAMDTLPNVTSVGTLSTLTVDNVIVNGTTIGHTSDTDLMTLASAALTLKGTLTVGIDGTGHDVKLYGDSPGSYLEWDQSEDKLRITDAGSGNGSNPEIELYRNSTTPANGDNLGKISFYGNTEADGGSTDTKTQYASIYAKIGEHTTGAEEGTIAFEVMSDVDDTGTEPTLFTAMSLIGGKGDATDAPKGNLWLHNGEIHLISTDSDNNSAPYLYIYNNEDSPSNGDSLGQLIWQSNDSGDTRDSFGKISCQATSVTHNQQRGEMKLIVATNNGNGSAGTDTTSLVGIKLEGMDDATIDVDIASGATSKTEIAGYFACNSATAIAAPTYTATTQNARNANTATADAAIQDVLQTLIADLIATGILQSS